MVGIVILNYNDWKTTVSCIDSILAVNTYPVKIVVVDNASTDDSSKSLELYLSENFHDDFSVNPELGILKKFTLVLSKKNGGYAQGNNLGINYLDHDSEINYVMILNSDVLFIEDVIETLVSKIDSTPDAGLVSPLLYCKDRTTIDYNCARQNISNRFLIEIFLFHYHDFGGRIRKHRDGCKILKKDPSKIHEDLLPIELPSGSCMLIKKDVFKEINWFDPNTFLYFEENILYKRLLKIGKQNYICPQVSCVHLGAQSTSKKPVPFLKVKEAESAQYYLRTYGNMTFGQKLLSFVAFNSFFLRMKITKTIRELLK